MNHFSIKRFFFFSFFCAALASCGDKVNAPDVSNISVKTTLQRFEKDFFAIDTNDINTSLDKLHAAYPDFLNDYLYQILNCDHNPDSAVMRVKLFIKDYKPIYDASEKLFSSFTKQQDEIDQGLKYVRYYFPSYPIPEKIITYVAPMESYASVLGINSAGIGLQLYLGDTSMFYANDYVQEIYPQYQVRRFKPEYIAVNCFKNIAEDIYPQDDKGGPLIYQMIEAGKKLYMLDMFLPFAADSIKTGYTKNQLEGCYDNEALIWNYFLQNNLLFSTDQLQNRDYLQDGPKTEALGNASPGFIGQFIGRQIIRKWMSLHPETSLQQLLNTPANKIYDEAKYKP